MHLNLLLQVIATNRELFHSKGQLSKPQSSLWTMQLDSITFHVLGRPRRRHRNRKLSVVFTHIGSLETEQGFLFSCVVTNHFQQTRNKLSKTLLLGKLHFHQSLPELHFHMYCVTSGADPLRTWAPLSPTTENSSSARSSEPLRCRHQVQIQGLFLPGPPDQQKS